MNKVWDKIVNIYHYVVRSFVNALFLNLLCKILNFVVVCDDIAEIHNMRGSRIFSGVGVRGWCEGRRGPRVSFFLVIFDVWIFQRLGGGLDPRMHNPRISVWEFQFKHIICNLLTRPVGGGGGSPTFSPDKPFLNLHKKLNYDGVAHPPPTLLGACYM